MGGIIIKTALTGGVVIGILFRMVSRGRLWCVLMVVGTPLFAQPIATAEVFLESVSQVYGEIVDYTADLTITKGEEVSRGSLSFLSPNRVRIDFTVPDRQALVSDGRDLWIYLPEQEIVLQQSARESSSELGLASQEGLSLLQRNYNVSFLSSPLPTPISGTVERGVHLKFTWRNSNEHFRELILAISDAGYIRMIRGTTVDNEVIRFDFTNIQINRGIPEARFDYEPPASANLYIDFLFNR